MPIKDLDTANVSRRTGERKKWPTVGTRVAPEELHLIDAAAARAGKDRAGFIHDTLLVRTREVLGLAA